MLATWGVLWCIVFYIKLIDFLPYVEAPEYDTVEQFAMSYRDQDGTIKHKGWNEYWDWLVRSKRAKSSGDLQFVFGDVGGYKNYMYSSATAKTFYAESQH